MVFMRLTLWGAFATLRLQNLGPERHEKGVNVALPGRLRFAVLGVAAVLAGCATIGPASSVEQKQKVVAERAQGRWDVLIKGDVASAYQFLSAGSKAETSAELYKAKMKPGMWRQAKVSKVDCGAETCKVTMLITYDTKRLKGLETPIEETWIIENGSAWYVYR